MENEELNTNQTTAPEERKSKFVLANKTDIHDEKFETKQVSYLRDCLNRFVRNRASVVGFVIILIIILFAIFEPVVDPKEHVSAADYPSGFRDANFQCVLPKLFPTGTGFWDGTESVTIGEADYYEYKYTDSNKVKVLKEEKVAVVVKAPNGTIISQTYQYKVTLDTYAVGTKIVNLSAAQYENLITEDQKRVSDGEKTIMKPMVDYTTYLAELETRLTAEYAAEGKDASALQTIMNNITTLYKNKTTYYYKLVPAKVNGSYSDSSFVPDLDDEGNVQEIYLKDSEGNYVYSNPTNGRYDVRVDYYDYFTYANGFELQYIFGSNGQGQDICLRLAHGARFSLLLGVGISAINLIIGVIYGAISGYYGGRVDLIMERITDIIAGIPTIIIMTITQIQLTSNDGLKSVIGSMGALVVAILIAFVYNGWVGVASTTRMQFYRFKGQEYVLASRTLGAKDKRLIFKHILPNAIGTLVTSSVLMIPGVIFSESSLSYLGIIDFTSSGISSIGALLNEGQTAGISTYPHTILFPALIISLLMISFNLFGNGLRDAFNTTLRGSED